MEEEKRNSATPIPKEVIDMIELNSGMHEDVRKRYSTIKRERYFPNSDLLPILRSKPEKWLIKIHENYKEPVSLAYIRQMYSETVGRKMKGGNDEWIRFQEKVYDKAVKKGKLIRDKNGYTSLPL